MKKILLLCAATAACLSSFAESKMYGWTYDDGTPIFGTLRRISANGRWAAGADYHDEMGAFIIDLTKPDEIDIIPGGEIYDISNDGLAVGDSYNYNGDVNYHHAAIWNGEAWVDLEVPENVASQSHARAISTDGKYIGGYCWAYDRIDLDVEANEPKGRNYPILWERDDATGVYHVKTFYDTVMLPVNQGAFIYDMTPDGLVMCGLVCTEAGGFVPALFRDGEMIVWNEFSTTIEPFYYNGKVIGSFPCYYVDGAKEGSAGDFFNGMFVYANDRYLYGNRTIVSDVTEDGDATYVNYATIYDIAENKFYDTRSSYSYMCGTTEMETFSSAGKYVKNNVPRSLTSFFGFEGDWNVAGIYDFDPTGKYFAGVSVQFNEAIGAEYESPVLVVLDEPKFAGISDVAADSPNVNIAVDGNKLIVNGAQSVVVYSISGSVVSTSAVSILAPGVYVVVADGVASKVAI